VLLLALDTCDSNGSVAVLRDETVLHVAAHDSDEDYSSWLLPAVERTLKNARIALKNLDFFAVASGPGSFTGVRVGLTTVKAWAEVYGRPIAAVSRLEALAGLAVGQLRYVAALTDAHRNQVFGALYRRRGAALELSGEEMVIAPDKFLVCASEATGADRIDWISTQPNCITGTDAWKARHHLGETVQHFTEPLAPAIGRLGHRRALQNRLTDALQLDANYVRRSDAEILWKGAKPA
jgi:tRNA threonylcarbamoyladenosine biosynthesis protein TsaB